MRYSLLVKREAGKEKDVKRDTRYDQRVTINEKRN